MSSAFPRRRALLAVAGVTAAALALAGCASGGSGGGGSTGGTGGSITVGTTDSLVSLDPAGSYDNGSLSVQLQVFPFLFDSPLGTADVEPDIAESGEFTSPNEFTVTLKPDLKWANGNDLTSSDVKFTFDRQLAIADPNGPSSLLGNLESIATPDDTTVVFTLKVANDVTFAQVLSSPAGPIVDEDSFSPTALTPDDDIVKANAFAGQYTITSYEKNSLIQFKKYDGYEGVLDPAVNDTVVLQYFADSSNLKLAIEGGDVDVAYRTFSPTDVADLRDNDDLNVVDGPGGSIRYIVFNFNTQPFGATTAEADPAKALAVRQALADTVDREAIADQVYKGTVTPLYSYVPEGLTGATESLKSLYGDGNGGPDVDKATATLSAAGVATPVVLNLQYTPEHYGPSSADEYALIKDQLESSGLFTVNLASTDWTQYTPDRTNDLYPEYQLGWYPDYSDADNYLSPFFREGNFLANHYEDAEVNDLIAQQAGTTDPDARTALIEEIQDKVAAQLSTVPIWQGAELAVTGKDVSGLTLDGSFKLRYAPLTKG
ncbi:ABC transporter substrate-binding protein [Naasia lichenicola]|uniref:Peptide ABC transporter substrate-binding protein n=1 Tax=Naasia lichenicola TaxID=2565933 RepID=A0A4S4FDF9_9MICO|nr:ABC transporter substrate-binding protein [Naasia lichenicola]THG28140.1 peptide ABC transporter substrate-binding protein [Naasia lichenicola]